MASVPSFYIKEKPVDYDAEIFACLNMPVRVADMEVYPPSFGVFSLLEVTDSMFIKDFEKSMAMDFCRCLYICNAGRESASEIQAWLADGGKSLFKADDSNTWLAWDIKVAKFADKHKLNELEVLDLLKFRSFLISQTFNGYDMIPNQAGGSYMPYLFGAETMASVVATCGVDAIWNMPLCLVGHIAAAKARVNGLKGVGRPKDPEDIKLQLKLAEERESKGELHPWQIKEPDMYGLTDLQIQARPEIKNEYNTILKKCLREKEAKANNG